jgi:AcrR family transcriptional regulator
MPDGQLRRAGSRADQRIPKLRTRGRANRKKLLAKAQQLIAEQGSQPIRFSDVFEAAGVSRGSAYRIYNSVEDLMQDLSSTWISNFVVYVKRAEPITRPDSWVQLSDYLVARAAAYWIETADILRVLPRVRSNVPESYRAALNELTKAVADSFDRYFRMPEIPDWQSTLAMYTSLGDMIFADAIRREGHISNQRLVEAQKICNTYLSFYLPSSLQARAGNT